MPVIVIPAGCAFHEGDIASNYQDLELYPEYDPAFHDIVETGQNFHIKRVPWRQVWFYISSMNKFFQSRRRRHAILVAAEEIIGATRWEEIQDALEEQGPLHEYLADLDLQTLKRKVQRARQKDLITAGELSALSGLLP